jgi:hypothetical protein
VNRVGARERETWLDGSFVDHSVLLLLYNKPKPRRSNELTPLAMNVRQGKERYCYCCHYVQAMALCSQSPCGYDDDDDGDLAIQPLFATTIYMSLVGLDISYKYRRFKRNYQYYKRPRRLEEACNNPCNAP